MNAAKAIELTKQTFAEWAEDKSPRLAAALAYYTLFSISPLIVIVVGIVGLVFGAEAARGQIIGQIQSVIGRQSAEMIQTMIAAASKPSSNITATVIGVITLLLGAAGAFGQLQDALNTIWGVEPKPTKGIWGLIRSRFLSFSMVLGVGFLLLVSLVVSAGLAALGKLISGVVPQAVLLGHVLDFALSISVLLFLFAVLFKYLPDIPVAWRDVWVGASVTAVLFTIGKTLIGLYLGRSSLTSAYGAAGSLVLLLLWIYYASQIFLFGAEFTKVYARSFGSKRESESREPKPAANPSRANRGADHEPPQFPRSVSSPTSPDWAICGELTVNQQLELEAVPVRKIARAVGWFSIGGIAGLLLWLARPVLRSDRHSAA